MKNPLPEYYPPLARKAVIFLNAAKSAYEVTNRRVGSEEVSFYLLSHAVELSIKALLKYTEKSPKPTHDIEKLAKTKICGFSEEEMTIIRKLKQLNDGPGGLRYDNTPRGQFLPSTFENGVKIVEKLIEKFK